MAALVNSGEEETLVLGPVLTHWVASQQLPIIQIVRGMHWKDAVRLAASSPLLWPHVEWLVALAMPNQEAALAKATPDRLRIPLLTGLTREQARANNYELRWACGRGRLGMAQWLTERFQLTAADARACDNYALRAACHNGHLTTAQWLVERFGLTAADARAAYHCMLVEFCMNEHLKIIQWLKTKFDITQEESDR